MKTLYLVTMESPVHPEHPVDQVHGLAHVANRAVSQRAALAEMLRLDYTIRLYRVDLRWWEDQHPVRFGLWRRVQRGGKRVHVIRAVYTHQSGLVMDTLLTHAWKWERW